MRSNETYPMLSSILEILKMLTEAGAEIYRVEESAVRIFEAYGAKNVDVYATTSNIIVSLEVEDNVIKTHTRRVGKISSDIEKIHRLNSLIRKITTETPDLECIRAEIEAVKNTPKYSDAVNILFFGVIAGAFYFFFGGRGWLEFLFSLSIGLVTGVLNKVTSDLNINKFFVKFISSLSASMLTFTLLKFGLITHDKFIITANIMTLIPGIGLTNALRDLFVGDSISGVLRFIEAALLAVAIASGYIVTIIIFGGAM